MFIDTYRGVVYPWHCDHMGHMNVMWYTGKFDEATWSLFSSIGISPTYVRDKNRGMVAVEQKILYKKELLAGDIVIVRSQILEIGDKTIRFVHEMIRADAMVVAATSELTGVHLDLTIRKSCPFPAEIFEKGRSMVAT